MYDATRVKMLVVLVDVDKRTLMSLRTDCPGVPEPPEVQEIRLFRSLKEKVILVLETIRIVHILNVMSAEDISKKSFSILLVFEEVGQRVCCEGKRIRRKEREREMCVCVT